MCIRDRFYGAACDDVNTVGGFANWVQDWEYTACPCLLYTSSGEFLRPLDKGTLRIELLTVIIVHLLDGLFRHSRSCVLDAQLFPVRCV